jgi:ABC-type polysaccharide/polyol phosphate transport system ATPase subunit
MVHIKSDSVSLWYKLPRRFTLERQVSRPTGVGGRISPEGTNRKVIALENVSFELRSGDRLGLVGTNGAGKTTLLKVLYGIFEPTSGLVDIAGKVDALFNINLGFRPEASGRRNIELRGLINGWTLKQIEERMDAIIEFSELDDFIDMPFKAYSQGMAARLAFSIATSFDPEILLMDEWIGAGDPNFQEKARTRMNSMAEKARIIVLASHSHALLKRTCNKILELEKGRLAYFGDADKWFADAGSK